jgi:crossover junction endodeoxyribonuclease RusA
MTRVDLPYTKPPLSMNDRDHWFVKAKKVRAVRLAVQRLCADLDPMPAAVLTLHYQPRDRRHRDSDNLFATVKAVADGIRDAGVIPDDDTRYLSHREPVIHPPVKGEPGRLWLELVPADAKESA